MISTISYDTTNFRASDLPGFQRSEYRQHRFRVAIIAVNSESRLLYRRQITVNQWQSAVNTHLRSHRWRNTSDQRWLRSALSCIDILSFKELLSRIRLCAPITNDEFPRITVDAEFQLYQPWFALNYIDINFISRALFLHRYCNNKWNSRSHRRQITLIAV